MRDPRLYRNLGHEVRRIKSLGAAGGFYYQDYDVYSATVASGPACNGSQNNS